VGVAGGGRALSKRQGQPGRWSKTQDSQRPDAATAVRACVRAAALVSHATVFAGDGGYANHMWSAALPERDRQKPEPAWTGKATVTFSGAITLVCRDLWCR